MKKAIITGATGVVGFALIKELINSGVETTIISRPNSKKLLYAKNMTGLKIYECDISNLYSLGDKLEDDYDVFFHLAWNGTYGEDRNNPYLQDLNVRYTLDAVSLASKIGCHTFVGAGSQAEYGLSNQPLNGKVPTNPNSSYGIAKYATGKLSKILCEEYNIKHVWCRILSVYGPNDNNSLIANAINSFLNNQSLDLTKGEQIWDYLYSKDCAKALILCAERAKNGSVYCLGSGKTKKLREYIEIIKEKTMTTASAQFGQRPYSENQIMFLQADISPLVNEIGFVPEYSFEDGISETIEWFKRKTR